MTTKTELVSNLPVPPGEYLVEVLEELGMSKGELATRMGRPLPKLSAIFKGSKAITPDTALQLERVTDVPAHIWTGMETDYRLAQARQREELREELCKDEASLVTTFCYNELKKIYLVPAYTRAVDKVRALQEFFGVMSLKDVPQIPRYQVAFRHKAATEAERSPEAVASWLRVGEIRAREMECAPFNADRLKESLDDLRAMTRKDPVQFYERLQKILADAGVALVACPHFPKTKAHGATFFLTEEKAVLMVTLRCSWADIFWFSLFHEIGHLLLHGTKEVILEGSEKSKKEDEADLFARNNLIAPKQWETYVRSQRFEIGSINSFAKQVGVSPGIVVGRLQHEEHLAQSWLNELRPRYVFDEKQEA